MTPPYRVEALDPRHDRQDFDCGVDVLNRYFKQFVGQDVRGLVSKCFVACPGDAMTVAGYYTLAAAEVPPSALPETIARKLPRYPTIPVVRMGRLAIDVAHGGKGLGAALVANAVGRALKSDITAFALLVDAKDGTAAAFYQKMGFFTLGSDKVLALPLATAVKRGRLNYTLIEPSVRVQNHRDSACCSICAEC